MRPLLALCCLLAAAAAALGAPFDADDADGVIVKLASGEFSIQEAAAAPAAGELGEPIGEDLRRYKLRGNETVHQVAQRLAAVPGVEYAVPDRRIWTEALKAEGDEGGPGGGPDDGVPRSYPESKGYKLQWGSSRIGMPAAWSIAVGAKSKAEGVTVCIVDSGVDAKHRNLAPNLAPSIGYNAVDGERKSSPNDAVGHGTEVAGVIAGAGKANGAVGVNQKNINLLACKFMSGDGWGKTSDAIQCMDACVRAGAAVISASWTSGQFANPPLEEAVGRVQRAGVLMVVSAGNQGVDMRRAKFYPQAYAAKYSNLLVVGATDEFDDHCPFSNHDPGTVHISAPGNWIYTTAPGGGHTYVAGTSIAAPFVTGAAALVLAAAHDRLDRRLSALEVKQLLLDSSELLPSLDGKTASGGRLRVDWALQALLGLRRSRRTPCTQRPGAKAGKCKDEMAKRKRMEEKAGLGGKAKVAGKSLSPGGDAATSAGKAGQAAGGGSGEVDAKSLVPSAQPSPVPSPVPSPSPEPSPSPVPSPAVAPSPVVAPAQGGKASAEPSRQAAPPEQKSSSGGGQEDSRFHQHDSQGQLMGANSRQRPADPPAQAPAAAAQEQQPSRSGGEEARGQPAPAPAPEQPASTPTPVREVQGQEQRREHRHIERQQPAGPVPAPAEAAAPVPAPAPAPAELAPVPAELAARVAAIEAAIAARRKKAAGLPALEAGEHGSDAAGQQQEERPQGGRQKRRRRQEWVERQAWEQPGEQQEEQRESVPAHPGRRMQGLPAFRARVR